MKPRPLGKRGGRERKRGKLLGERKSGETPAGPSGAQASERGRDTAGAQHERRAEREPEARGERVQRIHAEQPRGVLEKRFDENPVFEHELIDHTRPRRAISIDYNAYNLGT